MGILNTIMSKSLVPDKVVGKHFKLVHRLGRGGFGVVWKATDNRTGQPVAVKMLPHQSSITPAMTESLRRECEVLKTLEHPNICRVLEFAEDPVYGPLLVTEFVEGTDILDACHGKPVATCMTLLAEALQGLGYLHGAKVMHFDIKPANVLVSNNHIKIIDFGIAAFERPDHAVGTPNYMAPEAILNQSPGEQADLYALGVMMMECLTGINPFQSASAEEVRNNHLHLPPPLASSLRADVPPWLDAILAQLLVKSPEGRYQSAQEVLNALRLTSSEHLKAFAAASGKFIGRREIIDALQTQWKNAALQPPKIHWVSIQGDKGTGKTRLLTELKFAAQIEKLRTLFVSSAQHAGTDWVAPIAEGLASPQAPLVVFLDDYSKWMKDADAAVLNNLLDAMKQHPCPPTNVWCVIVTDREEATYNLSSFTMVEVKSYLKAVAPIPEPQCTHLSELLFKHTQGNPRQLAVVMTQLVNRGYFASASGQWDPGLFTDITIDMPSPSMDSEHPLPTEEELLRGCQEDRRTGHAARALERIVQYPTLTGTLLIEAAECALTIGKTQEALDLMNRSPTSAPLLLWKAILLMANRDYEAARPTLMEGLVLAQKPEDEVVGLKLGNQLARLEMLQKKFDLAIATFEKNREHEKRLPQEASNTILNNELGHALLLGKQYRKAIPILDEDIQKFGISGHDRRLLRSYLWRGECQKALGKLEQAQADYEAVIKLAKAVQDLTVLSEAYNALAIIHVLNGESEPAIAMYERALSLAYCLNDLDIAATITTNIGLEHNKRGDCVRAKRAFEVTLAFLENKKVKTVTHHAIVPALIGLAEVARQEKLFPRGRQCLQEAAVFATDYGILQYYQEAITTTIAEIDRDEKDMKKLS